MPMVIELGNFDPSIYRLQKCFGYSDVNKALGTDWRYFSNHEEAMEIINDLVSEANSKSRVKYANESKMFRLLSSMS